MVVTSRLDKKEYADLNHEKADKSDYPLGNEPLGYKDEHEECQVDYLHWPVLAESDTYVHEGFFDAHISNLLLKLLVLQEFTLCWNYVT